MEIEDLISAGTVVLIQAVDRFQPELGLKLKTLAECRIRGAMADYLRKLDPLPRQVRRFIGNRQDMASLLAAKLGRPPDDLELAEALVLTVKRYRQLAARSTSVQPRRVDLQGLGHCLLTLFHSSWGGGHSRPVPIR